MKCKGERSRGIQGQPSDYPAGLTPVKGEEEARAG